MLIAMWTVVGVLAAFNLLAGAGKAFTPWPRLRQRMPWTETTGKGIAYVAAWSEILGAIGAPLFLIIARTDGWGWAAWLGFAAVVGLTVIQLLAVGVHVRRREFRALPVNLVLIVLGIAAAALIAVDR